MKRKLSIILIPFLLLAASCQEKVINVVDNTFDFEASFSQDSFGTGESLSIDITCNRESVTLTRVVCPEDFTFDKLKTGYSLYVRGGRVTVKSEELVDVEYDQMFTMTIEVQDTENTGEFRKVELSCSLRPAAPEDIKLPERFVFNSTDRERSVDRETPATSPKSIKFAIEPLGCTASFYVKCDGPSVLPVNDQAALRALTADDLKSVVFAYTYDASSAYNPVIYYRAGGKAGEITLTVGSVYNPLIRETLTVYVKEDVILVVYADNIKKGFYKDKGGYMNREYGYAGYLQQDLKVNIHKFECPVRVDKSQDQGETYISTTEIDDAPLLKDFNQIHLQEPDVKVGKVKLTLYIDCNPQTMTSHFMKGKWNFWGPGSKDASAGTIHIRYDSDDWKAHRVTAPSDINPLSGRCEETVSFNVGDASGATFPKLTYQVNYCDDVVAIDAEYKKDDFWHPTDWHGFDLWHKDIEYDVKRYNLRYIVYSYKAMKDGRYMSGGQAWWLGADINNTNVENKDKNHKVGNPTWCIALDK